MPRSCQSVAVRLASGFYGYPGYNLFHDMMHRNGSLFWIVAVSLLYILLALSLGLLISTIAKTQLVALLASAMMLLLPVVMLSGMLFPIESMPPVLQYISALMPPRYYIDAMRKLMIMGAGVEDVLCEIGVLSAMTLAFLTIALKKFNVTLD